MSRVNIYLPDELADRARAAGLNVSALARSAVEDQLAALTGSAWLAELGARPASTVRHADAQRALDDARAELGA